MNRDAAFSPEERRAVYRAIWERRDIRSFRPDPIPREVLWRVLDAAHHAGSVGFMQPWNFLVVDEPSVRRRIYDHFVVVNERAAQKYQGDRRATYQSLKLQGLLDAPLTVVVTCDTQRGGLHVLGRATIPETDVYSTCLAVQNLWLAARAEGIGVGWMSLMEPAQLSEILGIPAGVIPVAVLCMGYPVEFPAAPMLKAVGWRDRIPLHEIVFANSWNTPCTPQPPERAAEPSSAVDPPSAVEPPPAAVARQARLTKPPGSLGRLEALVLKICGIQGRIYPRVANRVLLLMAGDHGVTEERVSAYPADVTPKMVYQFIAGGGAVNTFARRVGLRLLVADLGVDHDFAGASGVIPAKVRRGTRNFCRLPAMTEEEARQAVAAGRRIVSEIADLDLLALGEMGIGNTTSAAAVACAILQADPEQIVGRGTGIGPQTLTRKVDAVRRGLALHGDASRDPWAALRCLGGFEIAGLVGAIQAAVERRVPIVLDGFITGAAALVAARLRPETRDFFIAGHVSAEQGHRQMLAALSLEPILDLGMRLGEGSGAALAVGLIDAACATMDEMKTFEEAGIQETLMDGGRD